MKINQQIVDLAIILVIPAQPATSLINARIVVILVSLKELFKVMEHVFAQINISTTVIL